MKSDQGTYCKWHDKIYSEMGWKKQYHFWPDSLTRTEPLNSQVGFQDFSNFGWNYRQACVQIPLSPEVPGLNFFFSPFEKWWTSRICRENCLEFVTADLVIWWCGCCLLSISYNLCCLSCHVITQVKIFLSSGCPWTYLSLAMAISVCPLYMYILHTCIVCLSA